MPSERSMVAAREECPVCDRQGRVDDMTYPPDDQVCAWTMSCPECARVADMIDAETDRCAGIVLTIDSPVAADERLLFIADYIRRSQ